MRRVLSAWKLRAVLLTVALATAALLAQQSRPPQPATRTTTARPAAAKTANSYVDPALCATCHAEIAKNFAKTGMGRSFSRITPATVETFTGKPFYHAASDSYFSMIEHDGKMYQRHWQLDFNGEQTNIEEKQIDFALGSGNHAITYLHLTNRNTLQQLPLGWYAENGGTWAMLPGFDRADYPGSTRLVHYECMFCHNGYPKIPKGNDEEGAEPVFVQPVPEGIDCQRCHGPGQRHVDTVGKAGVTPDEIRNSIVNPKRLTPERELEVCMQCHLETSSLKLPHSIQRQGREPFSYIPGTPLENFRLSFDRAPGKNVRFEVAHGAYALRESQCFLKTQANDAGHRMTCTTCHDPHDIPRGKAATEHYNGVCRTCHAAEFTRTVTAGAHPDNPDCISCHMPKRRTDDAIHIVMTEHFIRRVQPGNLLAPKNEYYESNANSYKGEVAPYYPAKLAPTPENLMDVAVAQVRDSANLQGGIPQLAALIQKYQPAGSAYYVELAEALHAAGDGPHSEQFFNEALRRAPTSAVILLKLGNAQIDWQAWSRAETTLRRLTVRTPRDPIAFGLLGQALFQQGKDAEARAALTKAVMLDPDLPEPHNYLGALQVRGRDLTGAEKEFREALRLQPGNAEWQANLAGLLASRGSIPEARYLFELSIRLKPDYPGSRLNYARLLASLNENAAAEKQARAAVEADSGDASAHEMWGYLLTSLGDTETAIRELKTAVNLQPGFFRAHYELGVALGMHGDAAEAETHLRIAAQGADPEAKTSAQELLKKLGR
jgi:predicted CXXCH cytochrome family protein